jgi:hypothetical protein
VVAALAPVGAGDANLGGGMKGIAQEAVSVQLQQPLALLHVCGYRTTEKSKTL